MVAAKILGLYASVWEPLLSNELTGNDIIEFGKKLPKLRKALSCCVCDQLLRNRGALMPSECREHFACKDCRGKDRNENNRCKRCEDWSTYAEDESLNTVIKSYQDFCFFFLTNERIVRVLEVKHEVDPKFDTFKLIDLIQEGLKGRPRAKKRKLPSNATVHNKGVVPINIARKLKKTCITTNTNDRSQNAIDNSIKNKKVEAKKTAIEGQDKVCKPHFAASASDVANKVAPLLPPISTPSVKPFDSVKSTLKDQISTSSSTISTSATTASIPTAVVSKPSATVANTVTISNQIVTIPNPLVSVPNPIVKVSKPVVKVSKSTVTISKPTVTISKPTVTVSKPTVSKSVPVTISKPTPVTVSKPNISNPHVATSNSTVTVSNPTPTAPISSTTVTTPTATASTSFIPQKPVESIKAGVKSPPLVTIKVEVQTSPDKQQSPNHGSESPTASLFSTTDPFLDPLGEQYKSPYRPASTISKPSNTNNVACPIITTTTACSTFPYKITSASVAPSSQSGMAPRIIQITHPSGGTRTVQIPQQFRIPGRTVQILGSTAGSCSTNTTTESMQVPIVTTTQPGPSTVTTGPAVKRRIIFAATAQDLQRWPDTSKVLQFAAAGDLSRIQMVGIRPGLISTGQFSSPLSVIRTSTPVGNIRPVVTSTTVPLVRPPNSTAIITTNASPLGQTIFTSNSNQGMQTISSNVSFVRSVVPTTSATSVGSAVRPLGLAGYTTAVTHQVPVSSPSTNSPAALAKRKPEGCRCGNATPTPGKLTCIGQRCACYADRNACSDCKCKGCKNPYVPGSGGKKVLHGVRAFIDPQTNQPIPIIATHVGHGPSSTAVLSGIPHSTVTQTNPPLVTAVASSANFGALQAGVPSSMPHHSLQLIPVRFGPSGSHQYLQIANPQALQQMPFILSSSGHLQGNPSSGITFQGMPVSVSGLTAAGIHQISHIQQARISQMNTTPDNRNAHPHD